MASLSHPASPTEPLSASHKPPRRLRGWLLFLALVLAAASTLLAFWQKPEPYQDGPSPAGWSWKWFWRPVERNAWLRVPSAQVPASDAIVGVSSAENGRFAWVTMASGWMFRSVDSGHTWTLLAEGARGLPPANRPPVFVDGQRGWHITSEMLWTTRNGGDTWEREILPGPQVPRALSRTGDDVYCLTSSTVLSWTGQGWESLKGLNLSGKGNTSELDLSDLMTARPDALDFLAVADGSLLLINSRGTTLLSTGKASGFIRLPLPVDFTAGEVQSVRVSADRRQYLVMTRRGVVGINPDDPNTWGWLGNITAGPPMPMWWVADEGVLHDTDVERFLRMETGRFPHPLSNPTGWTGYALAGYLLDAGKYPVPSAVHRSQGGNRWERSLVLGERFHSPVVDAKGRIWVGSSTGLVLRSQDQGQSWERMEAQPRPVDAIWFSADGRSGYLASDRTYRFDPDLEPAAFSLQPDAAAAPRPSEISSLACEDSGCRDASLTQGRRWVHGWDPNGLQQQQLQLQWQIQRLLEEPAQTRQQVEQQVREVEQLELELEQLKAQQEQQQQRGAKGLWLIEADGTAKQQISTPVYNVLSFGNGVGIAFGANGSIFRTTNWGRTWDPAKYAVAPAPWYYATWLPILLLVFAAVFWRKVPDTAPVLGSQLTSDRPIEQSSRDVLGLHEIALGLSRFLRNDQTEPSLAIAVTGPWGAGKSSLLNLLKWDLWQYGLRPISFNAWHNEQGNPVAAFYEAIIRDGLPPLFTPEGVWFRWRLLLKRGQRHRVTLVTTLLISLFAITYYRSAPDRFDDSLTVLTGILVRVAQLLGASGEKPTGVEPVSDSTSHWFGVLVTLAGFVSVSRTLLGRLKAFGVDPAKLTAALQGSTKVADTRESVGFHARFAEDFHEVTRALSYPLVILVDDLERCSPANALKMLEAVNFLVSSGDCFVVMAVQKQVLLTHLRTELKTPPESEKTPGDAPRDLADHYLEKLINLEVKVPAMTHEHAVRLTSPSFTDAQWEQRRVLLQRAERGRIAVSQARKTVAWSFLALAATLSIALAWLVRPVPSPAGVPSARALAPRNSLADGGSPPPTSSRQQGTPDAGALSAPALRPQVEQSASSLPSEPEVSAAIQAVPEDSLPVHWMAPVILVGLMGLLLAFSRPSGGVVVTDSRGFQAALQEWMPVLLRQYTTPRSLKRFLNRLRYMAMLQGNPDDDREGPLVAFVHGWMESRATGKAWYLWLGEALRSARTGGSSTRDAAAPPPDLLPDAWLVAFSATVEQEQGRELLEELKNAPASAFESPPEPPKPPEPVAAAVAPAVAPAAENLQRAAATADAPGRPTSGNALRDDLHTRLRNTAKIAAVRDFRKFMNLFEMGEQKGGETPRTPPKPG